MGCIIYNFEQRTDEWFRIKAGKISGSNALKIMKPRGLGVGGKTYCTEVMSGNLVEYFEETFKSAAMQKGIDREPIAAEMYEKEKMVETTEAGFIMYVPENEEHAALANLLGVSPDKLVGTKGGLEIKCPEATQHAVNLTQKVCDSKYYDQIQMCLFVSGREWWDLISYNPDFKPQFRVKITRILPCSIWQNTFIDRAMQCADIIDELLGEINGYQFD